MPKLLIAALFLALALPRPGLATCEATCAEVDVHYSRDKLAAYDAQAALELANKNLVRRWLAELWDGGDFAIASELLASDFKRHSEGYPATGPVAYANIVKSCHDAFPDTRIVLADALMADGDRVFVRWRWTGTHKAPFRGIAPTGKAIDLLGEDVILVKDGKITDIWPLFDPLRLMLQIGVLEQRSSLR
jgi:steroid delta-isomerase-like uncharacterized protein